MENLQIPPELMAFIPVMMIIVQQLKKTPAWEYVKNWVPMISMAAGVAISYYAMPDGTAISAVVLGGLLLGASPVGVHEAVRNAKP